MTEGLIRLPHLFEFCVVGGMLSLVVGLEVALWVLTKGRFPIRYKQNIELFGFQFTVLFIRADLRGVLFLAYMVWIFTRNFPWKKWRNQLTSKLAGLTEVARASIERQQRQALS